MKGHVRSNDIRIEQVDNGVSRQVLAFDSDLMVVRVNFEKGAVGYAHQHPHQQISYVAEGTFEVDIDGKFEILSAGDAFQVSSNQLHGVKCLEAGVLIDSFSPLREDFI